MNYETRRRKIAPARIVLANLAALVLALIAGSLSAAKAAPLLF
jgi:hypothetical protein